MSLAKAYFLEIAEPLFERFRADSAHKELLWAALVALNQIPDYRALDETAEPRTEGNIRKNAVRETADLETLNAVANALKHGVKISKSADHQTLRNDFWSVPDVFAEPDFWSIWIIDIDGRPVSVQALIQHVYEYWRTKFRNENDATGQGE